MPQTSSEVQTAIDQLLGTDSTYCQDHLAGEYLRARGWRLTGEWCWARPSPKHEPTLQELLCLQYLIEEWDFGGIVEGQP